VLFTYKIKDISTYFLLSINERPSLINSDGNILAVFSYNQKCFTDLSTLMHVLVLIENSGPLKLDPGLPP
jgi:hypothetical protein